MNSFLKCRWPGRKKSQATDHFCILVAGIRIILYLLLLSQKRKFSFYLLRRLCWNIENQADKIIAQDLLIENNGTRKKRDPSWDNKYHGYVCNWGRVPFLNRSVLCLRQRMKYSGFICDWNSIRFSSCTRNWHSCRVLKWGLRMSVL